MGVLDTSAESAEKTETWRSRETVCFEGFGCETLEGVFSGLAAAGGVGDQFQLIICLAVRIGLGGGLHYILLDG